MFNEAPSALRNYALIQAYRRRRSSRKRVHQASRTKITSAFVPAAAAHFDRKEAHARESSSHFRNRLAYLRNSEHRENRPCSPPAPKDKTCTSRPLASSFFFSLYRILLRQCLLFAKFLNCLYGDSAMRRLILRHHKSWPRIF